MGNQDRYKGWMQPAFCSHRAIVGSGSAQSFPGVVIQIDRGARGFSFVSGERMIDHSKECATSTWHMGLVECFQCRGARQVLRLGERDQNETRKWVDSPAPWGQVKRTKSVLIWSQV
jgi:hypothetical protein